jgi:hypothetical protein
MGDGTVEIKTRSTQWLDRNCPCQAGFEFFDYTGRGSDHAAVSLVDGAGAAQGRAAPRPRVASVVGCTPAAWDKDVPPCKGL